MKQACNSLIDFLVGLMTGALVTGCSMALLFFAFTGQSASGEPPLVTIGLGETVITPQMPLKMGGFARSQVSTGVHDDLHARSLVIESGETVVCITAVSVCSFSRDEYLPEIRKGIREKTGIPDENIIVSCTHTHSGPDMYAAPDWYRAFFKERVIESTVQAWQDRKPSRIGTGAVEVLELGRNRRTLLFGGLHPDPETGVIRIEDAQGKLRGVVFNYGCHPSGLDWKNREFSEDWPSYAIKGIKDKIGKDVWVSYFQSAEGEIDVGYSSELSAVGAEMPIRNHWYIGIKGRQMADAVLKALESIRTDARPVVKFSRGVFDYPLRENYPVTVEEALRDSTAAAVKLAGLELDSVYSGSRVLDLARVDVFLANQSLTAARQFHARKDASATRPIEQQAVRIGEAVFVSLPGEVFAEIGQKIKEQSPFEKTFLIGLTNGYGGYLPPAKEFIEGNYEVNGSAYSPKTEKICIESSLKLIRDVQ